MTTSREDTSGGGGMMGDQESGALPHHWTWNPFLQPDENDFGCGADEWGGGGGGETAAPPLPTPDRETMEARHRFRDGVRRETAEHRRNAPGPDAAMCLSRNVALVLYDRERRGGSAVTPFVRPRRHRPNTGGGAREGRSPLTVFESPISTACTPGGYGPGREAKSPPVPEEEEEEHDDQGDDGRGKRRGDETTKEVLEQEERRQLRERLRTPCYPMAVTRELRTFAEHCSARKYQSAFLTHLGGDDVLDAEGNRPTSSRAVSTISIAFSPDARTVASTHGDHTVKISCCNSGLLLQSLEGHPRTPWTVKYHPTNSDVVASGCLGHQVRIWNWPEKVCLHMLRLEFAIISLSFHPTGQVLAVANGTRLHFWRLESPDASVATAAEARAPLASGERRSVLTDIDLRHMLRCVHFPPNGDTLIIGGVNPSDDPRRRNRVGIGGNGMSFYLRLYDFDLERTLMNDGSRRPISNPLNFVPRALLYNDGGFDVSPDGMTLCACAEFWLPHGVDNAMDLVRREEVLYGTDDNRSDATVAPVAADGAPPPDEDASSVDNPAAPAAADAHIAVAAALSRLRGISREATAAQGARSPSFREGMEHPLPRTPTLPRTPPNFVPVAPEPPTAAAAGSAVPMDFIPQTPPNPMPLDRPGQLSPPSPPGRRFAGGLGQRREAPTAVGVPSETRGFSTPPPPPAPPAPPQAPAAPSMRPPHPLSVVSRSGVLPDQKGRYVPHVVMVSLDTHRIPPEADPRCATGNPYGAVAGGFRPRLGQLLEACPLDPGKASAVTCVKFSPSTDFCLIGYGVREPLMEGGGNYHPVTALYRVRGGMTHVSTMLSGDDDVNIARFHPDSGYGFVYGTKQGRVRILSPRPWNYYNC